MGDLMPGIPSVPGDETTWAAAVDQFETLKKGDMPLSLTNWDASSTKPAIAAGSAIEIAGATYRFNSEAPILDITGVVAGTVHCGVQVNDPVSGECTAFFINGVPGWRDDLNGWYNAEGTFRYTGHVMDWDGADAYTNKRMFTVDGPGGELVTVGAGGLVSAPSLELTSLPVGMSATITIGVRTLLPKGMNLLSYNYNLDKGGTSLARLEVYVDGAWEYLGFATTENAVFTVISDGTNYGLFDPLQTGTFYWVHI